MNIGLWLCYRKYHKSVYLRLAQSPLFSYQITNRLASRYSMRPQPQQMTARGCAVAYIRGRPGLKGYQPDGRPAMDASSGRVCDIPDKGPRPCGGWKNPAGTLSPLPGEASGMKTWPWLHGKLDVWDWITGLGLILSFRYQKFAS